MQLFFNVSFFRVRLGSTNISVRLRPLSFSVQAPAPPCAGGACFTKYLVWCDGLTLSHYKQTAANKPTTHAPARRALVVRRADRVCVCMLSSQIDLIISTLSDSHSVHPNPVLLMLFSLSYLSVRDMCTIGSRR